MDALRRGRRSGRGALPKRVRGNPAETERYLRLQHAEGRAGAAGRLGLWLADRPGGGEEAEPLLRAAVREGDDDAYAALAKLLDQAERHPELEALYRSRVDAGDQSRLSNLGYAIACQPGREVEAEAALKRAVAAGDGVEAALRNLGHLATKAGRTDDAIGFYEQGLLGGDRRVAAGKLAGLLEKGSRQDEVEGLYRIAIDAGARTAPAHLARLLWERGELGELEGLYRLAIERRHGPAPAVELGCLLWETDPHRRPEAAQLVLSSIDAGIRWGIFQAVVDQRVVSPDARRWAMQITLDHIMAPTKDRPARDEFRDNLVDAVARDLRRTQQFERVAEHYQRLVDAGEQQYLLALAIALFDVPGQERRSTDAFEAAIAAGEKVGPILVRLGDLALRDDREDEAIVFFERAVIRGAVLNGAVRLAWRLADTRRDAEVDDLLRSAIEAGSTTAPATLAARLRERGETDELEDLLRLAVAEADAPRASIELACLLHDAGPDRAEEAVLQVGRSLDYAPTIETVLSVLHTWVSSFEAAEWYFRTALRRIAHLPADHLASRPAFRGRMFCSLARLIAGDETRRDEARELLREKAWPLTPGWAERELGVLAERDGRLEEAAEHYRTRYAEWGVNLRLVGTAEVRAAYGDRLGSEFAYRLAIHTGNTYSTVMLAQHLLEWQGSDAALAFTAERTIAGSRVAPRVRAKLLLEHGGDPDEAERALRVGIEREDSQASLLLGDLLAARGDVEEAEIEYWRAIKRDNLDALSRQAKSVRAAGRADEADRLMLRARTRGCPVALAAGAS